MLPDEPEGKVAICADNVYRIWDETRADRLTQLIFCNLSTPKGKIETEEVDGVSQPKEFQNVYDDIRKKLIAKGVPEHEIAFIHDGTTRSCT
jgi:hypothetical protein